MPAAPNYLPAVLRLAATLQPGRGYAVTVLHDSWCAALAGAGPCDCDPELLAPASRRPAHRGESRRIERG